MASITEMFQAGLKLHDQGQLQQAEQVYRQVLLADPRHASAMHRLGLIALQIGKPQLAVEYIGAATRMDATQAVFHAHLAEGYRGLGQLPAAVACYRQALALQPDYAEAHNNLGTLFQMQGNLAEAVASYRNAITLDARYADAHNNLGAALQSQGELTAAIEEFREALRLRPDYVEAQLGLGTALRAKGRVAEALACFEAAVRARPGSCVAHSILGTAYQLAGRLEEALEECRRAIQIEPRFADAHCNLGIILREQDRWAEALDSFREALRLKPSSVESHLGMASIYHSLVRPDEAVAACHAALQLNPRCAAAFMKLGNALQFQGELEGAIAAYRRTIELEPGDANAHSNLLYTLNFHPGYDAATLFAEHRAWAQRHAEPLTAVAARHENEPSPDRRLRVGYVSAHFKEHAVSFFSEPILAAHDHRQFEIYCYAAATQADEVTRRIQAGADQWREVAKISDEDLANCVRQDRIDILVDLAGHIGGHRLLAFARKPAPVQVTYLGYQNTTGMSAMDYRLSDLHADPPGLTDGYYTERLVRLPGPFFCYQPPTVSPAVNPLPALESGHVTFASLANMTKLTPEALQTWAEILSAVPGSRLIVLAYSGGLLERNVRNVMVGRGIHPDRVEVVDKRPRQEYLQLHHRIDIALDSFPFNGHTTVCDALWMGVPSIMLEGTSYASRFGGSALIGLGLTQWIGQTREQYVEIAIAQALDTAGLSRLRTELRSRMQDSPLVDSVGFTRNLESAYRRMWHDWCKINK